MLNNVFQMAVDNSKLYLDSYKYSHVIGSGFKGFIYQFVYNAYFQPEYEVHENNDWGPFACQK